VIKTILCYSTVAAMGLGTTLLRFGLGMKEENVVGGVRIWAWQLRIR